MASYYRKVKSAFLFRDDLSIPLCSGDEPVLLQVTWEPESPQQQYAGDIKDKPNCRNRLPPVTYPDEKCNNYNEENCKVNSIGHQLVLGSDIVDYAYYCLPHGYRLRPDAQKTSVP